MGSAIYNSWHKEREVIIGESTITEYRCGDNWAVYVNNALVDEPYEVVVAEKGGGV